MWHGGLLSLSLLAEAHKGGGRKEPRDKLLGTSS
jgi:hypothetical protein